MSTPQALFPVAVDPEALSDYPTDRDQSIHRAVVTTLGAHGILTVPAADYDTFFRAIRGLGDLSRTLWATQLGALYNLNRFDLVTDAMEIGERLRRGGDVSDRVAEVRLIVASRNAAEEHGVNDATGYRSIADTDLVIAGTIHRSPAVVDAEKLEFFPMGTTRRTTVARTLLDPLAARSSTVRVLDPHLLEPLFNGEDTPPHTKWLLQTLAAKMPAHSTLSILGKLQRDWQETDREDDEAKVQKFLARVLEKRTEPMTVHVRLLKATSLRNRFIWFSCGHSYHVLHNFTAASDEILNDDLTFTRHKDEVAEHTNQTALRMESNTQPTMVSVTQTFPQASVRAPA